MLDAGAFVALEKRRGHIAELLDHFALEPAALATSGGVIAEIWRGGAGKQAPIAMLLPQVEVVALDVDEAKVVGMLLGACRTSDPVDAHVVLLAVERGWPILTSDPGDLRALHPNVRLIAV